jgi:DNA-binding MarR family transcriptional regulator
MSGLILEMASESDAWRHSNIGRLLNNAVRRFEGRVLELLGDAGHAPVRLSHINMTRNLDITGTRVTELARRAAMTKQAMSELVAQCEEAGLVTRLADPTDARAKIIVFTQIGLEWLSAFRKAIIAAEDEMRQELGVLRVDGMAAALQAYTKDSDPLV